MVLNFLDSLSKHNPVNSYLFEFNTRNTRKRCEICSKLTIKTPERRQWPRSVFLLLILNIFHAFFQGFYSWLWTSKCYLGRSFRFSLLITAVGHIKLTDFGLSKMGLMNCKYLNIFITSILLLEVSSSGINQSTDLQWKLTELFLYRKEHWP